MANATELRTRAEIAVALAETLRPAWDKPADFLELADGTRVRALLRPDDDRRLQDDGDWYGVLAWDKGRESQRPAGFDGAARVVHTDLHARLWWQPPADVLGNPETLENLARRVCGYFRDDWHYVGVVVEVERPACSCCGEHKQESRSLWGIESDAGECITDVIAYQLTELGVGVRE